jgi:LacI family purine nucleotide synthesis repressor
LKIPDDVQLIGGAGLNVSEYFTPPLSVIGQPHARIGREAASMLLEMLDTGITWLPGQLLSAPLILRDSTDVPPHHAAALQHEQIESPSDTIPKETTP